jgi:hypothetical protein
MFRKVLHRKKKIFFIFSIIPPPPPPGNHAVYNVEIHGIAIHTTDGNVIWRVLFACRITMATDTRSEYTSIIRITFPRQEW